MAAVWYRFRTVLRVRWRAALALGILIGIGAGAVIAALAGARRTDGAYERFLDSQHASDVYLPSAGSTFGFADIDPAAVAELPQVAEAEVFNFYPPGTPGDEVILDADTAIAFADADGGYLDEIDRVKVLEGRRADPDKPLELMLSFLAAEEAGIEVGDRVKIGFFAAGANIFAGEPGPTFTFKVVGIGAIPPDFPPIADQSHPGAYLTPAFDRRFRDELFNLPGVAVRLHGGDAAVPEFKEEVEALVGGQPVLFFGEPEHTNAVERSIHLQAQALRLLALLLGGVALLVTAQAVLRQVQVEAEEIETLRNLGMTRGEVVASGVVRAFVPALIAVVTATAIGIVLSPLTPIGVARRAEPGLGVAIDGTVFAWVAIAVIVLVTGITALASWWEVRRLTATRTSRVSPVTSRVVDWFARRSFPAPIVSGVRMALESGRGVTAVPVRSTLVGAVVAVATVVGAVTFTSSLDHLLAEPPLYGVSWDTELGGEFGEPITPERADEVAQDPAVHGLALGTTAEIAINARRVPVVAMDRREPPIGPTVLEGREPRAADEILLGSETMRDVDGEINDTVTVTVGAQERTMSVVGRGVLPTVLDGGLGTGAFMTFAALQTLAPDAPANIALVAFAPGVERSDALIVRLSEGITEGSEDPPAPSDLVNFGRVDNLPAIMAACLALLAAAALAHTLVTAVRRRRRDLAILKTVGFVRGQVATTVAAQASTLVLTAVAIGVPLGVVAGRRAWGVFADQLGVANEPVTSVLALVLIVPAALVLANLVAFIPAGLAARTQPAVALRSE